jgi:hypothetical protein
LYFPVCSNAAVHFLSFSARGRERRADRHACNAEARYSTDVCIQAVAFNTSIAGVVCPKAGRQAAMTGNRIAAGGI